MYEKLFSCEGKNILVFGGKGLIGSEIVKAFHDFKAVVVVADKAIDDIKEEIISDIFYVKTDITSESSVKETFADIIDKFGHLDVMVNCAYPRTFDWGLRFEEILFESWKKNVDDQLGGCFLTCQLAAEQMKKQKSGSIINCASTYGVVAPDFSIYEETEMTMPAAYAAIKGGVITFTKYLATYYAKFNVRVNSVSPGGVFNNQPKKFVENYSKKTPLGRMAKPSELAGIVIFLASDASTYVTGQNILVDGGWTAW